MTDTWENELRALFRPVHGLQPCQLASWTALPAFSTPQGLRDHIAVVDAGLIAEGQADEQTLARTCKVVLDLIEACPPHERAPAVTIVRAYSTSLSTRKIAPWPVTPRRVARFLISEECRHQSSQWLQHCQLFFATLYASISTPTIRV